MKMSLCADEVYLTQDLSTTICDENYDLLTPHIIEQGDFDLWLYGDSIQCTVSTLESGDDLPSDPLLNQVVIGEDEIIEEASLMDVNNAPEDYIAQLEESSEVIERRAERRPNILRPLVSKLNITVQEHIPYKNYDKSHVLTRNVEAPMFLEITKEAKGLSLNIIDACGQKLIQTHLIELSETSHYHETSLLQPVTAVNILEIAPTVEEKLPQILTSGGSKIHLCPIRTCHKAHLQFTSAKTHALTHLKIKPYKCDIADCPWAFYTSFKLARHKTTHSKKKSFVCNHPGCQRAFTTIYNLKSHKKSHDKPANLQCPVKNCKKAFRTETERRVHCKTHSVTEAPYNCSVINCKKSFFSHSSLQTHIRSHTHKETELKCKWANCGKTFDTAYKLKEHMRKHTGHRPYVCSYDDCTWSFATASKLKRHKITHTNERKFHCTIGNCNKKFLRSEHLRDHTLTHIPHKSYECAVCGSAFTGRSSLCSHIRKMHPNKSQAACARAVPFTLQEETQDTQDRQPSADALLEQAIQSLGVPSDMIIGTGLLPEEPLEELLENGNFSTVNLRDLD